LKTGRIFGSFLARKANKYTNNKGFFMTKINFIISTFKDVWIENSKSLFIAEPYVHYVLKNNNELDNYKKVKIAPHYRSTREDLIKDNDFVDLKYNKYIPILAQRLNKIHNVNYDEVFWQKCLSLSLLRYITYCYDMYQRCEDCFDVNMHACIVLSKDSYYTPKNFQDHRDFFQTSAFGQEQIFSEYIHLFYPNKFKTLRSDFSWPVLPVKRLRIIRKIFGMNKERLITKLLTFILRFRLPQVAIIESYFSPRNMNKILIKGKGKIQLIKITRKVNSDNSFFKHKRKTLSESEAGFDSFDNFFFKVIENSMPKSFIEDFSEIYNAYQNQIKKYEKLSYIINESWIGNHKASMFIAIAQQNSIKHVYNEHNFLQHQFLRNNLKYLYPLVDKFITIGWIKKGLVDKAIQGGSLYEWLIKKKNKKFYKILYVEGPPAAKTAEFSSCYGESGSYNASSHLKFAETFFSNLADDTLKDIAYRGYPLSGLVQANFKYTMIGYDQEAYLAKYLDQVKILKDEMYSAKTLMGQSRIVVVDYLSTAYIESIVSNIPTIFFLNKNNYHLEEEYLDFYDGLISVGICQTDPIEAANFLEKIRLNPLKWWSQPSVQYEKDKFIQNNINTSGNLLNIIENNFL
jgi:putative transferase (TIGR04331 family)